MTEAPAETPSGNWGWAWSAVGAVVCAAMAPLEPNFLEEGMMLHVGERVLAGEHLYRDVRLVTGPFPFALVAGLLGLLGKNALAARAGVVVLHALACGSVYGMARRAGVGPWAHPAAACLAFAPVVFFPLLSTAFYATICASLAFASGYLALRGTRSAAWGFAAGVAVALTALSKQQVGAVLALSLMALIASSATRGQRGRLTIAFCSGGAVVALGVLGIFAVLGDLEVFVSSLLTRPRGAVFASQFPNLWPPGQLSPVLRASEFFYLPTIVFILREGRPGSGAAVVLLTQVLYLLPILVFVATPLRRVLGPLPPAVWAFAAVTLSLATNLFPRVDWGHLVYAAPAAGAYAFALLPRPDHERGRQRRRAWAGAFVLVLAAGSLRVGHGLWEMSREPSYGPRVALRPVSPPKRSDAAPRVIRYLSERLAPGEPIFVARTEPLLYFATGAPNPTPFTGMLQVWGLRGEQEERILEALESVRFVVMSDIDTPFHTFLRDELPRVQVYLERHFRVPPRFEGRRGDDAWLIVLERSADLGAMALDLLDPQLEARAWVRSQSTERAVDGPERQLPTHQNHRPLAALLGPGGGGVDFDLVVPEGARFRSGVGFRALGHLREPERTRFIVSVAEEGEFRTLGTKQVSFGEYNPGYRWSPFEVDLSEYAGRRVTLRLEAIPIRPAKRGRVALWGSPRIVLPAD